MDRELTREAVFMRYLERLIVKMVWLLSWVGVGALTAMMLLIVLNVLLRQFGMPIFGTLEFVEALMVVLFSCAVSYTAFVRGHISVSLLVSRLPARAQAIVDSVTHFIGILLFGVVSWRLAVLGIDLWRTGTLSATMRWPCFQYAFLSSVGFAVLCLVLLIHLSKSPTGAFKK